MDAQAPSSRFPWAFLLWLFVLSVPFWWLGAIAGDRLQGKLPVDLPVSALMAVNPLLTALILTYRESGASGVKRLLRRVTDYRRIERKRWYIPMFGLLPTIYVVAYALMRLSRAPLPADPQVPLWLAPIFFALFFVAAIGEEVGWQGYVIERLPVRWSALGAAAFLGVVWAVWHIVPDLQAHRPWSWITWQRLYSVGLRILIVWLFNNTGKSVFAVIVFHALDGVSFSLFPNNGSHYEPFFICFVTVFTVGVIVFLWGARTLADYRFARPRESAH